MVRTKRKGEPFSIRLTSVTDRFVDAEARRRKRSKSAVVEELTEEAARIRRFPGVGFRGDDAAREAWIVGTGLDVWEIVELYRAYDGELEKLLAAHESLSERSVRLALAYAEHFPEEIEEAIAENQRPVDEWQELYPFIGGTRAPGRG